MTARKTKKVDKFANISEDDVVLKKNAGQALYDNRRALKSIKVR